MSNIIKNLLASMIFAVVGAGVGYGSYRMTESVFSAIMISVCYFMFIGMMIFIFLLNRSGEFEKIGKKKKRKF